MPYPNMALFNDSFNQCSHFYHAYIIEIVRLIQTRLAACAGMNCDTYHRSNAVDPAPCSKASSPDLPQIATMTYILLSRSRALKLCTRPISAPIESRKAAPLLNNNGCSSLKFVAFWKYYNIGSYISRYQVRL